jgi:hypothetical protein
MSDARAENLATSQAVSLEEISQVAAKLGIDNSHLYRVGDYMAKIKPRALQAQQAAGRKPGKLILVSAVNPTPAGEGKTTTSVGLAQALAARGERVAVALREPSLGPVFGIKGGGCGGGHDRTDGLRHPSWTWDFITSAPIKFANLTESKVGDGSDPVSLATYINSQLDPSLSWDDRIRKAASTA